MDTRDLKYWFLWVDAGWPPIPRAAKTVLPIHLSVERDEEETGTSVPVCMPTKQFQVLKATLSISPEMKKQAMRMKVMPAGCSSWDK